MTYHEKFWKKAAREGHITERQQGQLTGWLDRFYHEVDGRAHKVVMTWNGFSAVGHLRQPTCHDPAQPPVNEVLVALTTASPKFRHLTCTTFELTEEEASDLGRCIEIALKESDHD